jgi:hypothetical protein
MWMLVSLDRVKTALRVTHDNDDGMIEVLISGASKAVLRYLKGQAGDLLSIDSPPDSPPNDLDDVEEDIQVAVILLVGHFYRNPDNDVEGAFERGYLPKPVTALLYPHRDPTLA